jgi:hypothetical protein
MCGLCSRSSEERKISVERLDREADGLERMARHLRGLVNGRIKPHTDEAQKAGVLARAIVRYLVEEYV